MKSAYGVWFCLLLNAAMAQHAGAQDTMTYMRATSFAINEDKSYSPRIERPAYDKHGPVLVLDAGHRNFPYQQALSRLLAADGYRVEQPTSRFAIDVLSKANILVIANPGVMRSRKSPGSSEPLFTEEEAATVAVAFTLGKGRVVVLGDGITLNALVKAQAINGKQSTRKMGLTEADNQQFALNAMHWLSGLFE